MLRDHEPDSFDKLTKKQRASYCLIKDKDGQIGMRRKHKYFMQIQMQMAITGYPTTTFMVQTPKSFITLHIDHEPEYTKKVLWAADDCYKSVFIEEYLQMKYLPNLDDY